MKVRPMKKILLSLGFGILGFMPVAQAQFDAQSKKILDKVSAIYQSYNTLEADILLSIANPQEKEQRSTGTLAMERASGKFRINLGGHEIINNGQTQWTVLKDQHEIQVADAEKDGQALSPSTIFTFYKEGYKGAARGTIKEGNKVLDVIVLTPTNDGESVSKIEMFVDGKKHMVDHVTVFDKNGGKLTYSIRNLVVNRLIPYGTFVFHKSNYPSMEMVDLR